MRTTVWRNMKFPKNRANLYLVERTDFDYDSTKQVILGGFANSEDADNFKDACEQEWLDKVGSLHNVDFDVTLTTFYG